MSVAEFPHQLITKISLKKESDQRMFSRRICDNTQNGSRSRVYSLGQVQGSKNQVLFVAGDTDQESLAVILVTFEMNEADGPLFGACVQAGRSPAA